MSLHQHPALTATKWSHDLAQGLPEALLRWLLADCAEKGIPMAPKGVEIDSDCLEVARLAKEWLAEWSVNLRSRAQGISYGALFEHHLDASWQPHWCSHWAIAPVEATPDKLLNAAQFPGWPWVLRRLKHLIEVWATCGERAPFLLHQGQCPIEWEDEADAK